MGTDIVIAIEYSSGDDKWHYLAGVDVDRDYLLFAIIANKRNSFDIEPVAECRGHPDNLAPYTKMVMEGGDQAETWLNYIEWLRVVQDYKAHAIRLNRGCHLMSISIVAHIMWDIQINNKIPRLIICFN